MNAYFAPAVSALLFFFAAGLVEAKEPPQPIKVFQDASPAVEGLSVKISPDPSKKSDTKAIYFILSVTSLFSDEIFLTVTGFEDASYLLEEHIGTFNRVMSSGAGAAVFPDNTQLLKRLHAALGVKDNATITCGCCAATIPIKISMDRDNGFSDWVGRSGVLTIPLRGYFRSSGKEFFEIVKVPFVVPQDLDKNDANNPIPSVASPADAGGAPGSGGI